MSSPASARTGADDTDAADRRRSGRVSKRPVYLGNEQPGGAKRKRASAHEIGHDAGESDESEEESDEDVSEEEQPDTRRKRKQPAPKKPRTNGVAHIPIRPATSTRARKTARKPAVANILGDSQDATGIYKALFFDRTSAEEVASAWIGSFGQHESLALAEIVNFVLKCCGCDSQVTQYDIEDVDGVSSKLGDLQAEFQAQNISDYPLIAKGRSAGVVKATISDFFSTLIKTMDAAGLLFGNAELIENLQVWLSTMAAANSRPFRHTATVASLAIMTAISEIGKEVTTSHALASRQADNMSKGKGANKKRASGLKEDAEKHKEKQTLVEALIRDWFDTIFLHRHRDVEAKIRIDCAEALGHWVVIYPDTFFQASYLRYLGWQLSDSVAPARHEALKQLLHLYERKDRLDGLKVFTDRFRERIVEMATLDTDQGVRTLAINLLDILRQTGLLAPDDIDAVGRLIFDTEDRIRKAVAPFLSASINDLYESKVQDDLGGDEAVQEEFPEADETTDAPGLPWLKLKCVAEVLQSFDALDPQLPAYISRGAGDSHRLQAAEVRSRLVTVAEALYPTCEAIHDWQAISAFLLFDTTSEEANGASDDIQEKFRAACKLTSGEELLLIEALGVSLASHISELIDASSSKKSKKQKDELSNDFESTARQMTKATTDLLKKYGDSASSALAVLRLEATVTSEAFVEYQPDLAISKDLLNEIARQFLSHSNEDVLTEASSALLRAKNSADLAEAADEKIDELWDQTLDLLQKQAGAKDPSVRGSLKNDAAEVLAKTIFRVSRLAFISDPCARLELVPEPARGKKASQTSRSALDLLLKMIRRGVLEPEMQEDRDYAATEDALARHAAFAVSLYIMWTISSIKRNLGTSATSLTQIDEFTNTRDELVSALIAVLESRSPSDSLAADFVSSLLDPHITIAALRRGQTSDADNLSSAVRDIPAATQALILRVLTSCEQRYAHKSGYRIEKPREARARKPRKPTELAVDADPLDEDEEEAEDADDNDNPPSLISDSSDDDEDENDDEEDGAFRAARRRAIKMQSRLLAEKRLCELGSKLVLAVLAGVVDEKTVRRRLELNKTRLGANWKEVCRYLDVKGESTKKGRAASKAPPSKRKKSEAVVVESDREDEDAQDEEEDEEVEDVEMGGDEAEKEVESVIGD